jgi:hypothetical protein
MTLHSQTELNMAFAVSTHFGALLGTSDTPQLGSYKLLELGM